eukprot:CAMPEP_0202455454 /NCGR_PEP_ID=MMETSP1360-20130828/12979_1 /ASSEMBLY_ACC=CAM_ASM_000848 /TAXON_ID=515479 /ORGANISM="Licmophora paradoxa, Strain CCMP2313" /LENGTH=1089 /DNA_ID=CAMNT_0049075043 /DNA_START=186 /DNA_END=3455 /DNA_ORIENTATION=+
MTATTTTTTTTTSSPSSSRRPDNSMKMLVQNSGGLFELEEMVDSEASVNKQIEKSPKLWRAAGLAALPASALLGFGLAPTAKLAATAIVGVVGGVGGLVGRSKMIDMAVSAATPAIAKCLIKHGIDDPSLAQEELQQIKESFGCQDTDFTTACTDVYKKYLVGMVKFDGKARSQELTELENLKKTLALDNAAVGEAHYLAAQEWYRNACLFVSEEDLEDEECPEYQAMNKFLFLTERSLRQNNETDEAFVFEMTRTAKVFNITCVVALERINEVVEPFYHRALKSARGAIGTEKVSSALLERARKTLGVSEEMAYDLHEEALNDEVRALLGFEDDPPREPQDMKFPEGALERLEQFRQVLCLTEEDVQYEITSEGFPLFQATATETMKEAIEETITPEEAWQSMEERRKELLIAEDKRNELVSSTVIQALGGNLEEVKKFADVDNEVDAYKTMLDLLKKKKTVVKVLEKAGWEADFYESFCNPVSLSSINAQLTPIERTTLFSMFMKQSSMVDEGKLTDEQNELVSQVKGLLGISDMQLESQVSRNFGPKLIAVLEKAMGEILEEYTPELLETLTAEVQQVVDDCKLSDRMIQQSGRALYSQAVNLIKSSTPQGIPSVEQNEALAALKKLYRLGDTEISAAHLSAFGSVYRKAVEEAMSITGTIRPEYKTELLKLQSRIGVSERQVKDIFLEAVKERMIPLVEWIVEEMERTIFTQQQLAERRKKDLGEDYFQTGKKADGTLGLGAEINVLGDIMNLVDFYTENEIAEERQIDTKAVEKTVTEDGEEKIVEEEVPVYETLYPITALQTGAITQEMAEVVYRQFVVGSFTTQGPNALRYEKSRAAFGGILGLTSEKMEEIGSTIAETVYDNYVSTSMRQKGALDQQDLMFLANLQGKLGLTSEQGEALMTKTQKKILSEEADALVGNSNPLVLKAFREKCNSMGIEMDDGIGISKSRKKSMFEAEVSPGLNSGEIGLDSGEILTEIQESLGMDPEEAEEIFGELILKRAEFTYSNMEKGLRRGKTKGLVEPIKNLILLGRFVNGELGLEIQEGDGEKVFNLYEVMDLSDLDESTIEENKALLRTILGLSS